MGGRSAPPSGIFAIGGGEAAFQPADDEPGRGLAEEDLAGAHRGDDELVEGAHFPFPGHRESRHQQGDHQGKEGDDAGDDEPAR